MMRKGQNWRVQTLVGGFLRGPGPHFWWSETSGDVLVDEMGDELTDEFGNVLTE
jgi:hypothetical protein